MALKASNPSIEKAYKRIKETAFQLKRLSENRSAYFAAGAKELEILALVDNLNSMKDIVSTELAGVPAAALIAYARIQEDDAAYDMVAEAGTMVASIDAILLFITANIPAPRTFGAAATAPLVTRLNNLTATIT